MGGPGAARIHLINPFGLHYAEVTPDNLVRITLDGTVTDGSSSQVNRAGFVIHSAIHRARGDAHCIMHIHTTEGCAVSCKEEGLRHDNFYSAMLYQDVGYHDYEGVTTSDAGRGPNRQIAEGILKRVPETRVAGRAATNRLIFEAMLRRAGIRFRSKEPSS